MARTSVSWVIGVPMQVIKFSLVFFFLLTTLFCYCQKSHEKVLVDKSGVIKWSDNKEELSLFGANYCLPSACDYRAAGYFTKDRKKVVDQDMAHFARMGWDGLRVCLWGDYENSDKDGNLINNDHLDLMDYLIAKATERHIFMLFSPIVTYSSQWPDAMNDSNVPGFSNHFKKSELGTNPQAIAAQVNYLKQILNHVNPYTGKAVKDEPNILFIEMINEPQHHSDDVAGSIKYINALVDAVRSTGCHKILFHNISQDFNMALPIQQSKVQGVSFAWYPTGLNSGMTLKANYLRTVDHYDLMLKPELKNKAKIVYEFDQPDLLSPTMYPAMARTFRSVGAQFASIFSYDMMVSAPYNLGWQTHFINMVYTPQKAVGAIIAAEAMRQLPRMKSYGDYPDNKRFGNFRVSYEENLSEFNNGSSFMYAGSTKTVPAAIKSLKKIVGFGSSPVADYEGEGIYFLDKVQDGVWRLEVYPDAVLVRNPFSSLDKEKIASRAVHHEWKMTLTLDDLGSSFEIKPINQNNTYSVNTDNNSFQIRPGVYLVTKAGVKIQSLPEKIGNVKFDEFVAPESQNLPAQIIITSHSEYRLDQPIEIKAKIVDDQRIDSAHVYYRSIGSWFRKVNLKHERGYDYTALLPNTSGENYFQYCIAVYQNGICTTYPDGVDKTPGQWGFSATNFWAIEARNKITPITLFQPKLEIEKLSFTRIGDNIRHGIFKLVTSASGEPAFRMSLPMYEGKALEDYTASLIIKDKISSCMDTTKTVAIEVHAKGLSDGSECYVTLVESDGTSWSTKISLAKEEKVYTIPVTKLVLAKGVMLPLGYPGQWNYWLNPAKGRTGLNNHIQLSKIEHLQISLRSENFKNIDPGGVEISSVKLIMD